MATISRDLTADRLHTVIETQRLLNATSVDVERAIEIVLTRAQAATGAEGSLLEVADIGGLAERSACGIARRSSRGTEGGPGLSQLSLSAGIPLRCRDTRTDRRLDARRYETIGVRSLVVAPLRNGGRDLGVLTIMSGEEDAFTDTDTDVLELLGHCLAGALAAASKLDHEAELALQDPLTGLPNKLILMDRLTHCAYEAGRYGRPFGVFFIDVDRFTDVNARLGVEWGDAVLRAVAQALTATVRAGDTLARLDGDHFVILCENAERGVVEPLLRERIKRVFTAVNEELRLSGYELRASVGVAWSASEYKNAEVLLDSAGCAARQERDASDGAQG